MKTSNLLAALALSLVASGAALADGAEYDYPQAASAQSQTANTRAEVVAELKAARANGTVLAAGEADYAQNTPFVSTRSRADVIAETRAAQASGELARLNSEAGYDLLARQSAQQPTVLARH